MRPSVLVLHLPGTNRDHDVAEACVRAGGSPEILPLAGLLEGGRRLSEFQMLVLPGGFSHGDDLGAGRVWAMALRHHLRDQITDFVESGRPVLGICNGFQALIKAGLLPLGKDDGVWAEARPATLTNNASGKFECRWIRLKPNPLSPCVFTAGLSEEIYCPVAHGEGRVVTRDADRLSLLEDHHQVALRYTHPNGDEVVYPHNPNGSQNHIAALCNAAGNVMGMMPHPEDHIWPMQHPGFHRGRSGQSGLVLFQNGINYAAQL